MKELDKLRESWSTPEKRPHLLGAAAALLGAVLIAGSMVLDTFSRPPTQALSPAPAAEAPTVPATAVAVSPAATAPAVSISEPVAPVPAAYPLAQPMRPGLRLKYAVISDSGPAAEIGAEEIADGWGSNLPSAHIGKEFDLSDKTLAADAVGFVRVDREGPSTIALKLIRVQEPGVWHGDPGVQAQIWLDGIELGTVMAEQFGPSEKSGIFATPPLAVGWHKISVRYASLARWKASVQVRLPGGVFQEARPALPTDNDNEERNHV